MRCGINPHTALLANYLGSACCGGAAGPLPDLPRSFRRLEVFPLADCCDGGLCHFLSDHEQVFFRTGFYKTRKRLPCENIGLHSPVECRPGLPATPFEHAEVSRAQFRWGKLPTRISTRCLVSR